MKIISDEFAIVSALAAKVEAVGYFSHKFKDHLEWQILGAACDLMKNGGITPPYYATKTEQPDFRLYSIDAAEIGGVELTESMPKGYLRHKKF